MTGITRKYNIKNQYIIYSMAVASKVCEIERLDYDGQGTLNVDDTHSSSKIRQNNLCGKY